MDLETEKAGLFPRSITPLLGDRSDKIATTEYVLNLATNDVGGRIYVSEQIGSDSERWSFRQLILFERLKSSAVSVVNSGVKETIIVSGGDYVEEQLNLSTTRCVCCW